MTPDVRVVVVSASVGAGHDGAAAELGRRLEALGATVAHHDGVYLLPPPWGSMLRRSYLAQVRWEFDVRKAPYGKAQLGLLKVWLAALGDDAAYLARFKLICQLKMYRWEV